MASNLPLICDACEALAEAAAENWTFTNAESCLKIVIRKKLVLLEEDDGLTPLLVIVGKQVRPDVEAFEGVLIREYEVLFGLFYFSNMKFETELTKLPDAAVALQKALHVTSLSGVSTVFDSDLDTSPAFDANGIAAGVDYSVFKITYKSSESRTS